MSGQFRANPTTTYLAADTGLGLLLHASHTLGNAGVVTTVTVPDEARGFRLTPNATGGVRFAINEDPAAAAATSGTTLAYTSMGVGNTAAASTQETRTFPVGKSRTLRLAGNANGVVVLIEFFGTSQGA